VPARRAHRDLGLGVEVALEGQARHLAHEGVEALGRHLSDAHAHARRQAELQVQAHHRALIARELDPAGHYLTFLSRTEQLDHLRPKQILEARSTRDEEREPHRAGPSIWARSSARRCRKGTMKAMLTVLFLVS